jgi:hypothetical protein
MRRRIPIRPDIHERFLEVVARVEAKLEKEEKELARRLAAERARENREEKLSRRSSSIVAPHFYGHGPESEPPAM